VSTGSPLKLSASKTTEIKCYPVLERVVGRVNSLGRSAKFAK
jgi:hypothetical protein